MTWIPRYRYGAFPHPHRVLGGHDLWAHSYYIGTAGQVSAQTIQRYIERVEHIDSRA